MIFPTELYNCAVAALHAIELAPRDLRLIDKMKVNKTLIKRFWRLGFTFFLLFLFTLGLGGSNSACCANSELP